MVKLFYFFKALKQLITFSSKKFSTIHLDLSLLIDQDIFSVLNFYICLLVIFPFTISLMEPDFCLTQKLNRNEQIKATWPLKYFYFLTALLTYTTYHTTNLFKVYSFMVFSILKQPYTITTVSFRILSLSQREPCTTRLLGLRISPSFFEA